MKNNYILAGLLLVATGLALGHFTGILPAIPWHEMEEAAVSAAAFILLVMQLTTTIENARRK